MINFRSLLPSFKTSNIRCLLDRSYTFTTKNSSIVKNSKLLKPLTVYDAHSNKRNCMNICDNESINGKLDLKFEDYETAFKSKTTLELIRAYLVFLFCSSGYIVDNNTKLIELGRKMLGEKLFVLFMKSTFFGHFVGGEHKEDVKCTLDLFKKYHVNAILDYAVEKDISQEEAEDKEMKSSTSSVKEEEDCGKEEYGGKLQKYKPEKQFADRRNNVDSARTYFYENEAICDENAQVHIDTINMVSSKDTQGYVAIKLTALGRPQLLLQLSEIIIRTREFANHITGKNGSVLHQHLTMDKLKERLKETDIKNVDDFVKNVEADKDGIIHLFPWNGIVNEHKELSTTFRIPSLKEGRMVRLITQLSKDEEEMFGNMINRMNRIICVADEKNVSVLIDAEQTYFQPAISRIAMEMMYRYNKTKAVVFNTYQAYLRESFDEIETHLEEAERQNFHFGVKLVRGAYINQERERAKELGYPDPINPTYEATTDMFYKIADDIFERIKCNKEKGQGGNLVFLVASHNEDTIRHVIEQMETKNIQVEDKVIIFAQLLGMCDYVTFPLGNAGYLSFKYVPYGPVMEVIPYLSRRAKENKSMLQKLEKEKRLLISELKRRIVKGQIFHKP